MSWQGGQNRSGQTGAVGTDPFDPADPAWAAFKAQTPEHFLKVAGDRIRNYLGWHLAPEVTETADLAMGSRGIVMLPSRHVTNVHSVTVAGQKVSADDFWWSQDGWLELRHSYHGWPDRVRVTFNHGYDEVPPDVKEVAYELVRAAIVTVVPAPVVPPSGGGSGGSAGAPVAPAPGAIAALTSPGGYHVQFRDTPSTSTGGTNNFIAASHQEKAQSGFTVDQAARLANYRILGDF